MRPLVHFLAKLYPRRWRQRYGPEFAVLLHDATPAAHTALNVFTGAMSMQIRTWNVGRILTAAGFAGVLMAVGIGRVMPNQYVSSSVVKIASSSPEKVGDSINGMAMNILDRGSLTQIMNALGLYRQERARMPIDDVLDRMRKNIRILPVGSAPIPAFAVQFSYSEPALAQRVTNELTGKFITENLKLATETQQAKSGITLQVLDPANLPDHPLGPNRPVIAFAGLLGGLALGGIFALLLRLTRRPQAA